MREMKDSGIAWIGEIPKEWEVAKLGTLYTNRNEKVSDKDYAPLSVTMKGILPQLETAAKTDDGDNRKLVRKGDFAINSRSDRRGSCGISSYDGSVSLINTILCPRGEMNPSFYNWLFHTTLFADEFYRWGHGIVDDLWTTRWQEMKNINIVVPALEEQRLIANFLDEKCGEIDELVALQEKMIEELKAYKQSVITETVTKGLDKNVKMKDSGVEWIGEIPEYWRIVPITKYLESLVDYRGKTPNKVEDGIQLITARNIKNGVIDYELSKEYVSEDEYDDIMHRGRPQIGDVLFTTEAPLGNTANVDRIDIALAQRIIKFRPNSLLNPYFLKYWIMGDGFQQFLLTLSTGSTATGIKGSKLFMLITTLPPLSEQHQIATYLDEKCSEIDSLISIKQKKIEELKDYKKSLIYEYVTGKKQVG